MPSLHHRLRARLMPAVLDTSKQPILWLLLTLIAVFGIGMLVLSSLNLDYSQKAMAALRKAQIEETFHASLNRIDAQQSLHEHYTEDLARLGELFWQLRQRPTTGLSSALQQTLAQKLRDIDDVFGLGIWFKPGEFSPLTL
ncbi:MAG: hypothetical protein RBS22_13805, partial [Spongiibacteraceae bacterium]|nr:hypothetical protein [Spongiibacteraceae bacterium]